jgi:tetratricopeptide (TPR) repeat protein
VLWKQRKLEEALEQFRRALEIIKEKAPDSLNVATYYKNIGSVLHDQGKWEEALEQYHRALKIEEEQAPDSLFIATSYNNNIAVVLHEQGKLE